MVALRGLLSLSVLKLQTANEVDLEPAPVFCGKHAKHQPGAADPRANELCEDVRQTHRLRARQLQSPDPAAPSAGAAIRKVAR